MSSSFYDLFHKGSKIQTKVINPSNFTYRNVLSVFKDFIGERKKLSILDYGCGSGTVSLYLAKHGQKVVGLDISDKAIEIAKRSAELMDLKGMVDFFNLTNGLDKIENKKFDIILCLEVIEHLKKDKELISFFGKRLKKEGFLILSTPSKNALLYKLGLAKGFDKKVGHLRRYFPEEVEGLLSRNGFRVLKMLKTEGFIRNSLFLFPIFRFFLKLVKGPISDFVTFLDNLTIPLFGESDILVIAKKE